MRLCVSQACLVHPKSRVGCVPQLLAKLAAAGSAVQTGRFAFLPRLGLRVPLVKQLHYRGAMPLDQQNFSFAAEPPP